MDELFQLIVKSYGLVGFLILAPLVAVVYLWKQNQELHRDAKASEIEHRLGIEAAKNQVIDAQKQRVEDAKAITDKIVMIVSEQSGMNKETNLALERLSDLMAMLQAKR